jgi:hypothetical protein
MQILDDMEEYEIFDKVEVDSMRNLAKASEPYAESLIELYKDALYDMCR